MPLVLLNSALGYISWLFLFGEEVLKFVASACQIVDSFVVTGMNSGFNFYQGGRVETARR